MYSVKYSHRRPTRSGQAGASIVELMVGLVVSLLVGLAATGAAISFTAQQRAGVGIGGVAVNAQTVMTALRDEAAAAGLGFFADGAFLCPLLNLSVGTRIVANSAPFSPIQVTRELNADVLDVVSASRVEAATPVRLVAPASGASAALASFLPVATAQAVLMAPRQTGNPCLIRTVTQQVLPTAAAPRQELTFSDSPGTHNGPAFAQTATFQAEDRVTMLGELQWSRFRRVGTDLVLERPLSNATAVVARDVVAFRIQYGVTGTAANSNSVETWQAPAGTFATLGSANIGRVRALRVGLIVRSAQRQKPDANGACSATDSSSKPALFGAVAENLDNTDWACWRYRNLEVVVPLRNVAMGLG